MVKAAVICVPLAHFDGLSTISGKPVLHGKNAFIVDAGITV
jgi:hypothetical protein